MLGFNISEINYRRLQNFKANKRGYRSFKIFSPIKGMCWAAPTPCSYNKNLKVKNWHGFKIIQRAQEQN